MERYIHMNTFKQNDTLKTLIFNHHDLLGAVVHLCQHKYEMFGGSSIIHNYKKMRKSRELVVRESYAASYTR